MINRVATNASVGRMSGQLAESALKLNKWQDQIASGKKLQRPSDGPGDVANALTERATLRRNEQYEANLEDANGWLKLSDDTLVSMQENLTYARSRLIQAANAALDATGREAVAKDLEGVKAGLLQLANTSYQGRYIFSGTAGVDQPPYDPGTGVYAGNTDAVTRSIADGVTLQVNVTGPDVFGTRDATATPPTQDLFQVFDEMAAAVRAGDVAAMNVGQAKLEVGAKRVDLAQTRLGSVTNQVESALNRTGTVKFDVQQRLAEIEDVDLAEAIIGMRSQEAAYQAALGVTAKVIQPSLLDFLR